jgi:hypothetical protein
VLGCRLMRETEEAWAALRINFIPTLEVNGGRRAEQQQAEEQRLGCFLGGRRSPGGPSLGGRTGPKGQLGRTAWRHGPIPKRSGAGHKKEWAEIRNELQKPFSVLNKGFEFKNQGFKYF